MKKILIGLMALFLVTLLLVSGCQTKEVVENKPVENTQESVQNEQVITEEVDNLIVDESEELSIGEMI